MNPQGETVWLLEFYFRRLLLALAVLAAAGWLLGSLGLFLWLNREPHNQVGWLDLAAPWRWPGLRVKRGDTAILAAMDEIRARQFVEGYYNLRVGLARSPGNATGRLLLARILAPSQPEAALTVLEEGLPYAGDDRDFLSGLLGYYASQQVHAHALEVIDHLLQARAATLPPSSRLLLQCAKVVQLLDLERNGEAGALLDGIVAPPGEVDARLLVATRLEYLVRCRRFDEARQFAAAHPPANPDDASRARQEAELAVAAGDGELLQTALRRLKAAAPLSPAPYLLAIRAWHRLNRPTLLEAAQREYFRLFGADDAAMQAVAALAVELRLPEVITRAQMVAVGNRHSSFAFKVHLTEEALLEGKLEDAMRRLGEWENSVDTLKPAQRFYPEFVRRLTRAAFTGAPDQVDFLLAHLAEGRIQAQLPSFLRAMTVLENAGNAAGAERVVQAGLRRYPQTDTLLAARSRFAARLAAAPAPEAKPSATAPALPATGAEALKQLDDLMQANSPVAARDLLRAIRAQKPAWLPTVEAEIALREIKLAFVTLDPLNARGLAQSFLDRNRDEALIVRLVETVSWLADHGKPDAAQVLYREIESAPAATGRVRLALKALPMADDLAPAAASAAAALATLDRHIEARQWTQAAQLLRYLQDKPPAWLEGARMELKAREVSIRLGLYQRPLALDALKELVVRGGAARSAAFKLVRDRLAGGDEETAVILAREIVRLLPDDPAARRLLNEAQAPKPAE
ncbi:MAG TPA: hypothetical protein VHD61_09165 [Lacunisphaera sp.]|nr:hypothetical protein [Lacunisphaera sp.]